jgi:hypothetical protein
MYCLTRTTLNYGIVYNQARIRFADADDCRMCLWFTRTALYVMEAIHASACQRAPALLWNIPNSQRV